MPHNYKVIHKDFRLNGILYTSEALREVAYSLIKEGEPYERVFGDFLSDWLDEKSTIEVRTSGSTGKPKKVLLQKRHMVNSALATGDFFNLNTTKKALLCLPTDYIAGKMMLVRAMVLGLELDFIEPSSNPLVAISKNYDFCAMVPLQLENSLPNINNIKTLIVGGAAVSSQLIKKVRLQANRTAVYETYGMTETITHIAVKKLNAVRLDMFYEQGRSVVEALGGKPAIKLENSFMALPNVHFSIDERNCLVIDAPKISEAPVVTNDVVKLISDTEFEWLGRYDNVINSGGIKLFPEQIESKLGSVISSRFFVTGLPDEKLGQKLVLIVEGEIDSTTLSQKIAALSALNKHEIPKTIYSVSSFRETNSGKIKRKKVLELLQN